MQNGWHGKADILILNTDKEGLPVCIGEPSDDQISVSSFDVTSCEDSNDNSWSRIIAETIVFSFLQHKHNYEKLRNNLIPGISINNGKLVVFMYDCEKDVLLGSVAMDLFDKNNIHMRTVIFLWLVLNYKLFCSGVIDDFKNVKANFHRLIGAEKLKKYKTEVSMPFHKEFTQITCFDPHKLRTPTNLKRSLDYYPVIQSLKVCKKH